MISCSFLPLEIHGWERWLTRGMDLPSLFQLQIFIPSAALTLSFYVTCSLNWQHQLCKNPRPNPDIKTLFVDHSCRLPNDARAPSPVNNPLLGSLPKAGGFPPLGAHGVGVFPADFGPSSLVYTFTWCSWLSFYVSSHFNQHLLRFRHPLLVGCLVLPLFLIQLCLEEP